MKFLYLAVAVLISSSHFAEAHDVRTEKRERSHHNSDARDYSKVDTGAKTVKESRGKRKHDVKHMAKTDERVGGGHPPHKRMDDDELSLIIGGTDAQAGEFPYYVNLSGCGASLIAPGVVLSAAHCGARNGETVFIGTLDRGSASSGAQSATVTQSVLHPQYNDATLVNDLMLLKLDSAVTTSGTTLIMNTQTSLPSSGQMLTVIGTGRTSEGGFQSDHLLKVDVAFVDANTCQQTFWGSTLVPEVMLCAGGKFGEASCNGDSGGPIVIKEGSTHRQVGVVSFGSINGCAVGNPNVYARIDTGMGWIKSVVCDSWNVAADFCGGTPPTGSPPTGSPPTGSPPTGSPPTGGCTDLSGWTDSFGDGCDWYASSETGCQDFATDQGTGGVTPVEACCVCKDTPPTGSPPTGSPPTGSPPTGGCIDTLGWTDSFGDGCDWYASSETGCQDFATDVGTGGKTPVEACCVCQGGGGSGGGGCTDVSGWTDSFGDGCQWYADNETGCQDFATDVGSNGLTPVDACCVCKY